VVVRIAEARLYWDESPNVLFPVPKGDPRAAMSGYNSRSLSAAVCSIEGWTMGGEKFAIMNA